MKRRICAAVLTAVLLLSAAPLSPAARAFSDTEGHWAQADIDKARAYGLMEGQFKRTFVRATGMKGITGDNLLQLLELRLDNVVYRSGLAASRAQARQLVCHGLMTVNGKKVDIPSYTVKQGDVIGVKSTKKDIAIFKAAKEGSGRVVPKWITTDLENLTATVAALPQRDDVDLTLQENMIVEFYSR